jgi:eukaryotic-like serine/threonine-protein kinase
VGDKINNLEVNSLLGHYRITSKIGAGGMGEVFLAEDLRLHRRVALKVLPENLASDKERLRRFEQEAFAASALNHPNILVIHEFGESAEARYIVSEYIEGKTLRQIFKEKTPKLTEILDISIQIATALSAAHQAHLVHRDIKPENIMVRPDGFVKILDFGLAKPVKQKMVGLEDETLQQNQTAKGVILGTVNYMSPEQAKAERVDERTDIFSLGALIYEMITGRSPFVGDSISETLANLINIEPQPLARFAANAPDELERIVSKMLRKNKDERYQTMKGLLADLKSLQKRLEFEAELKRTSPLDKHTTEAQTQIFKTDKQETKRATAPTNLIAVLPFTNMSADAENEYFCDGLAEELLNALSKIEDLRVAARTSAFSFKNKNIEVSEIGKTLNVKTILEGSVRKSGNRVRITVQLINAADGYHLWSERYDREMKDIFDIQDEITLSVIDALKIKLFSREKEMVLKRYTENAEAYQLYLKGQYYWFKGTPEGVKKSRDFFQRAIDLDPTHTPSYVGLAGHYGYSTVAGWLPPKEGWLKLEALLTKALELDETLPEVHNGLAALNMFYYRDWSGMEREVRQALELNPKFTEIRILYSFYLAAVQRLDEAIAEVKRGLEIEPLSVRNRRYLGNWLHHARLYDEAIKQYQEALEIDPNEPMVYEGLGDSYEQKGLYSEAINAWQKAMMLTGDVELATILADTYADAGFSEAVAAVAGKKLEVLNEKVEKGEYVPAIHFARAYIRLGDKESAFYWLEKAGEERNMFSLMLNSDPFYDSLRSDSRYQNILRRIGLLTEETAQDTFQNEANEEQTVLLSPATTDEKIAPTISKTGERTLPANNPIKKPKWRLFAALGLIVLATGFFSYRYFTANNKQIESIAVMPFVNQSGNEETEYLSDGMTETLINNLSQLPNLSVKARSSVFHYKGKQIKPQTVGSELSVQAILNGRVVQRGDNLTLSLELVDVKTGNQIWGEQYNRKQSDLVELQTEIARDVSQKLRTKLSGADEKKLAKNYTANPEAYQLYLKGRHHFLKITRPETEKAISYFQQAIAVDPNYALAYAGLADAYRAMAIAGEMSPAEFFPKAKAAAQKAIEIDNTLADANAVLGFITFWFDWNWNEAENQFKRALELDPDNADAHIYYANLLSNMKRHDEALAEAKRARELDPLNLRINALEAQFLIHAGQTDEALARLQKTLELNPDYWLARIFTVSAYIEKGMYGEAVTAARGARDVYDSTRTIAFLGFALAKSGKQREARAELERLTKLSAERWVSPYNVAMISNGLDEREKTIRWLERGIEQRDPRVTFLKVEPKWNNLRSDARYQDLLRRIGLPQ